MGTGKTIQSLALSWVYKHAYPLLIVVPSSLVTILLNINLLIFFLFYRKTTGR